VGLGQLKDLQRRVGRMRSIYKGYAEGLRGVDGISILPFRIEGGEIPQWTDVLADRCDELYGHLAAKEIHGRRFWHPLHTQKPYRMPANRFPNSAKQGPRAMWLPSAFTLSDADVMAVCDEIRGFLTQVPTEKHVKSGV
jgi:perosamine synthetase